MNKQIKSLGVVAQVKLAFKAKNRLATAIGFLLGGFVPVVIYFTAHRSGFAWDWSQASSGGVVIGGMCYSAHTVFNWARMAFSNPFKSAGFVVMIEGVLVTSQIHWLTIVALAYLVCINGISTGCTLSLGAKK